MFNIIIERGVKKKEKKKKQLPDKDLADKL